MRDELKEKMLKFFNEYAVEDYDRDRVISIIDDYCDKKVKEAISEYKISQKTQTYGLPDHIDCKGGTN